MGLIETDRLSLRFWRKRDAKWLIKWGSDEAVAYPTGWYPVRSYPQAWMMIMDGYNPPWAYALELKKSRELIGSVSIMPDKRSHLDLSADEVEIGFWLARPYWGQGIMKEALNAVMKDLFEVKQIRNVYCICDETNRQSIRVQEKLGFRYNKTEDIWQQSFSKNIRSRISCLSSEDWRSQTI